MSRFIKRVKPIYEKEPFSYTFPSAETIPQVLSVFVDGSRKVVSFAKKDTIGARDSAVSAHFLEGDEAPNRFHLGAYMEINKTYSPLETELTGINHYLGRIVLSNLAESIRRCFINMFCDSQHGLKLVNSESISLCKKLKRGTFTDRELALVKMIHKKKNDMLGKGVSLTFTQWESQIADKLVSELGMDCAKPKDTVLSQSELFGRHDLFTADDFKKDIRMAKEIESQVLRLWMVDTFRLSDKEEVGLQKLERLINVPYDCSNPHHRTKLQDLWDVSFPEEELHGLISEQWTKMG